MPIKSLCEAARDAPRLAGRGLIKAYRYTLSPLVGFDCRHLPTCSEYADQAIERFGLWAGGWMTLARLLRCQPFGTSGLDFVPAALPPRARWYMPWRFARWRGTNPGPPAAPAPCRPRRGKRVKKQQNRPATLTCARPQE
jgi:putative membrane protein insertion efficiency factor